MMILAKLRMPVALVIALLCPAMMMAQPNKQIILETKNTAMVLTVGPNQKLYQSYLGARLNNNTDYATMQSTRREAYISAEEEEELSSQHPEPASLRR